MSAGKSAGAKGMPGPRFVLARRWELSQIPNPARQQGLVLPETLRRNAIHALQSLANRLSSGWDMAFIACGGVALVALVDFLVDPSISFFGLYACGVATVAFLVSRQAAFTVCALAGLACYGPYLMAGGGDLAVRCTNCALGMSALLGITWAGGWLRVRTGQLQSALDQRTAELQAEMADRKALEAESLEAGRREQKRIAHQLHDAMGGNLAGASFRLKTVIHDLKATGMPGTADCQEALAQVGEALAQARSFARVLDPVEITGANLREALAFLERDIGRAFRVDCRIGVSPLLPTLSDALAQHLYFVVLEASRNAVQHATAERIRVRLLEIQGQIELTIQNDGRPWPASPSPEAGMGLRVMRHRMASLGGDLEIETAAGTGTILRCRAPAIHAKTR